MNLLDRYLIKRFLSVLFFSLLGMVSIFIAVNYVENADKFIDRKVPSDLILEYYVNFIPNIITLTLPVDILLASLFSLGGLARFNELTAIKSSGVSLYRMIMPLLLIGLLVSLANFWVAENIVPVANSTKSDIWRTYVDRVSQNRRSLGTNITMYHPDGEKVFIDRFDKRSLVASNLTIEKFHGQKMIWRLDAIEASWDSARSVWMMKSVTERVFTDSTDNVRKFPVLEKADLFFGPDEILKREQSPEEMNFVELRSFISKLRQSGAQTERWEVDYQLKFAYPLTCFFMVLFGAPLAASRKKSGAGVNIFFTLVICFAYYTIIQMGRFMGYNRTLDPIMATWVGNTIFGLLSAVIFWRMRS